MMEAGSTGRVQRMWEGDMVLDYMEDRQVTLEETW
jgi:hypothetical protein